MKVLFIGLTPQVDLLELDRFKASSPLFPEIAKNNISPVPTDEDYEEFEDYLENEEIGALTVYDLMRYIQYLRKYPRCKQTDGVSMFELEIDNIEEITNMIDALSTNYLTGYKVRDKVCMKLFKNLPIWVDFSVSNYNYDKVIEVSILETELMYCSALVGVELLSLDHINDYFANGPREMTVGNGYINMDDLVPLFSKTEITTPLKDPVASYYNITTIENKGILALITGYGWFCSYMTRLECIDSVVKLKYIDENIRLGRFAVTDFDKVNEVLSTRDYIIEIDIHAD